MHEIPHRDDLRVTADGDVITLEGRFGSPTLCLACCRRVAGVRKVL